MQKSAQENPFSSFLEKAKNLPNLPGCYLMLSKDKAVLYVGKAKNLKKRVSSYFTRGFKGVKTDLLLQNIADFKFIVTISETDAYILENNLIKKHSPKYNIRMRDDKSYPYVLLKRSEPFPKPQIVRRPKKNSRDFLIGPFPEGSHLREIVTILIRLFKLRDCSLSEFKRRENPCLLYQMKYCSAPCVKRVSPEDYEIDLNNFISFFQGKGSRVLSHLNQEMTKAAEEENFEQAMILRDEIEKLTEFVKIERQKNAETNNASLKSLDVWGFVHNDYGLDLVVGQVREGIFLGNNVFHFLYDETVMSRLDEEVLRLLSQYYLNNQDILPGKIVVDLPNAYRSMLEKIIESNNDRKVVVKERDFAKSLANIVLKQAHENYRVRISTSNYYDKAKESLRGLLQLEEIPKRVECYDIAIWQGKSPTASKVVFLQNALCKKEYRYYNLKEIPSGNNDFLMMETVIKRRFSKDKESLIFPDVLLIDGGVGQVSSTLKILKELNLKIPVVGIIKEKVRVKKGVEEVFEERLVIPGRKNHFVLKKDLNLYRLLTTLRDEAHRFSRKLHHKNEKNRLIHSFFDDIEGIGPKTRVKLLKKMDISIEELSQYSIHEIREKFDISIKISNKIWKKLKAREV